MAKELLHVAINMDIKRLLVLPNAALFRTAVLIFFGIPLFSLFFQLVTLACAYVYLRPSGGHHFTLLLMSNNPILLTLLFLPILPIALWGLSTGKTSTDNSRFHGYGLVAIVVVILICWLACVDSFGDRESIRLDQLRVYTTFVVVVVAGLAINAPLLIPATMIIFYLTYLLSFLCGVRQIRHSGLQNRRFYLLAFIIIAALAAVACWQWQNRYERLGLVSTFFHSEITENNRARRFKLFQSNRVIDPLQQMTFLAIDRDYPIFCVTESTYPLAVAIIEANYSITTDDEKSRLRRSLIKRCKEESSIKEGKADIFLSDHLFQRLNESSAVKEELYAKAMAKDALVFMVNSNNPVTGLTLKQIQSIYSGAITDWRDAGGHPSPILAFQGGSYWGAQPMMKNLIMKEIATVKPLRIEMLRGIRLTMVPASYQNRANAIGYISRAFIIHSANPDVRILSVDGVDPTQDNIRHGLYPYAKDIYLVSALQPTANTQRIIDWLHTSAGQQLVIDTGFVPLLENAEVFLQN